MAILLLNMLIRDKYKIGRSVGALICNIVWSSYLQFAVCFPELYKASTTLDSTQKPSPSVFYPRKGTPSCSASWVCQHSSICTTAPARPTHFMSCPPHLMFHVMIRKKDPC